MLKFLKNPIFIISLIIALAIGGYLILGRNKKPTYDFVLVQRGNVIQEVSVTGRVKPAANVDLAFEKGGRIIKVLVKVGDKVAENQFLVGLDNTELSAQLAQAQAGLQVQQAKMQELKQGTRPEEIQITATAVVNAQKALTDAENNLNDVKDKASADLQDDYDSALAASQKSVSVAKNSLLVFTDIQYVNFNKSDQNSMNVAEAKAAAVLALLGSQNSGWATTETLAGLKGGAFGTVQNAVNNPTYSNIDKGLAGTANALQKIRTSLEAIPIITDLTTVQRTNIASEKSNINTEINTIVSKQQAIAVQKTTNANNITTAETSVNSAKNTLASAQDELALKKAGSTPEQIAAQEAEVKQSEANVKNYQAQIAKTVLRSPINGKITKQDTKVGEIVAANVSLVSVMSSAQFEIEANVPEADIAKVKVGNSGRVTLDAYGNDALFEAKVISVDPAETMIEGVATYKTKLQFLKEDERLKSGLTANIDILTDKRENVLLIPQRALKAKDGEKFVQVLSGQALLERKVQIGLKGADGNVEIIDGLQEREKVVLPGKE